MRRTLLLVPLLLLSLAPAAAAQEVACHGGSDYVQTLSVSLPPAPSTVRAGTATTVAAVVTRAGTPVVDAAVYLRLRHGPDPRDVAYGSGRTGIDGSVVLEAAVPQEARGPLHANVEAFRPLVSVPCYGSVEEHGLACAYWGRAVR